MSREHFVAKIEKLIKQATNVRKCGVRSAKADNWRKEIEIAFNKYYGVIAPEYKQWQHVFFDPDSRTDKTPESTLEKAFNHGMDEAILFLKVRLKDESAPLQAGHPESEAEPAPAMGRDIFVVHGHDDGAKNEAARFLEKLELHPIILHEQPNQDQTVIEKFEAHAGKVSCAVVILTPDDVAYAKNDPATKEERARQNVIFELGYFAGKLGRSRTIALLKEPVSLPSDLGGFIHIPFQTRQWELDLVQELKDVGYDIDANKAFA